MTRPPECTPPCQDHPYCSHGDEVETCPICGATGPCYLDDKGRPLVHTDVFPTATTEPTDADRH